MSYGMISWSPGIRLEDIEKQVILKAFAFYQKNKTTTANALGIAINTLSAKLEKYESDDKARAIRDAEEYERDKQFLARQRGPHPSYDPNTASREALLSRAGTGVHVEPAAQTSGEQALPVQKPQEVQKVLHGQVAQGGHRKNR